MQEDRPDVVFVSFEEPDADAHFARLLKFAPHAKRVRHVEGIFNAYRAALDLATTPRFFVVDGDNRIVDEFQFVAPQRVDEADIWMWLARNAVNGLTLMNGGIKLYHRDAFLSMQEAALDFSFSMKGTSRVLSAVASETRFNASPFLAWRTGFRECAKLASGMMANSVIPRVIHIWRTVGAEKPNGEWCMLGARMGAEFGKKFAGTDRLQVINDIRALERMFEKVRGPSPS